MVTVALQAAPDLDPFWEAECGEGAYGDNNLRLQPGNLRTAALRSLEVPWALCLHYMWIIQEQHLECCVTPKMCARWMLAFNNLSALITCYIVYLHSKTRHFSTALWYREMTCTAGISHCTGLGYWLGLCLPKGRTLVGERRKLRPRVPSEATEPPRSSWTHSQGLWLPVWRSLLFSATSQIAPGLHW